MNKTTTLMSVIVFFVFSCTTQVELFHVNIANLMPFVVIPSIIILDRISKTSFKQLLVTLILYLIIALFRSQDLRQLVLFSSAILAYFLLCRSNISSQKLFYPAIIVTLFISGFLSSLLFIGTVFFDGIRDWRSETLYADQQERLESLEYKRSRTGRIDYLLHRQAGLSANKVNNGYQLIPGFLSFYPLFVWLTRIREGKKFFSYIGLTLVLLLVFLSLTLTVLTLLFLGQRSPILAVIAAILFVVYRSSSYTKIKFIPLSLLFAVVIYVFLGYGGDHILSYGKRTIVDRAQTEKLVQLDKRFQVQLEAFNLISQYPLGTRFQGLSVTDVLPLAPHNTFLTVTLGNGWLAGIAGVVIASNTLMLILFRNKRGKLNLNFFECQDYRILKLDLYSNQDNKIIANYLSATFIALLINSFAHNPGVPTLEPNSTLFVFLILIYHNRLVGK